MKKKLIAVLALGMTLLFCACANKPAAAGAAAAADSGVTVDYGKSALYTQQDMDAGIALIEKEFGTWDGCEMHSIKYAGDDCNSADNVAWMNQLSDGQNFTQCMEFLTDFHSPKEGGGAWEPDSEYKEYQWWLARPDGGDWQLLSWGY